MVRKAACILICFVLACPVASCGFDRNEVITHVQVYDSAEPVMKYVSGLDDFESIEYEAVTNTTRFSMGPHEPTYRGVVVLGEEFAAEIWNKYEWEEAGEVVFEFEKINENDLGGVTWYYSEEFQKDTIKYERVDYIYFDGTRVAFSFKSS